MMKNYNVKTTGKTAVPRSKRLRDAGGYQRPGSTTVVNTGSSQPASSQDQSGDGHTHANKAALDAISIDNLFYLWLKQKLEGDDDSTLQKVKAGYADDAAHADESDHTLEADHAEEADHALDSDQWTGHDFEDYLDQPVRVSDIVQFLGVIADAFMTSNYEEGVSGAGIDEDGNGELANLLVRGVGQIARAIVDLISTRDFISGFPEGTGWAITPREVVNAAGTRQTKYELEIDDITARGTFRVFEFIISQLLGMNGTHVVSDMMRVDHINPATNTIYLDTDKGVLFNPFRPGDLLMVQQFSQGSNVIKQYQLEVVTATVGNTADGEDRLDVITYRNFVGNTADVAKRDVLTRADSNTDSDRKGVIKMTSVESGSPYIDVIYGLLTDPNNSLRLRLGRLTGIITYIWGRLNGYGLYSDNAYLTGEFRLKNGKDVRTQFEVLEGKLQSAMQSVVNTLQEEDNYLSNATFKDAMRDWTPADTGAMYSVGDGLLDIVSGFYSEKLKVAETVECDGRLMLRIKESSIRQSNAVIRKPEDLTDNKLYLTIKYRCEEPGTLTAGFSGSQVYISESLARTDDFDIIEVGGLWDGTGDFQLAFTGDIYIETLMLTNHPLEDYQKVVSTRFTQTAEQISAVATRVTALETASAGWITTADGNLLWASRTVVDDLGNTVATHTTQITQTAEQISAVATRVTALETASAGWITAADGNLLWANKTVVDELGNTVATHTTQIAQTAEQISAVATRVTDLETASAGWITAADGNRLWASKTVVDNQGTTISSHTTQISQNASSISSVATRVTALETASAGWITSADGNLLWAAKSLESGNSIISYINQNATTLTISASRINISGAVTFSAFDSSLQNLVNGKADSSSLGALADNDTVSWSDLAAALQNTINGKTDSSSLGALAGKDSVSWSDLASALQTLVNGKANTTDLGALAGKSSISWSDLAAAIQNTINGKADSSGLGSLAYASLVELSNLGSTVIVGGYLQTSLINTDILVVRVVDTKPSSSANKIRIDGDGLWGTDSNGVKKIRVDAKSVGGYESMFLQNTANYTSSGYTTNREITNGGTAQFYLGGSAAGTNVGGRIIARIDLGYFDVGSNISVNSAGLTFSVNSSNSGVMLSCGGSAFRICLERNGVAILSVNGGGSGKTVTAGNQITATHTLSWSHTVGTDGDYSIVVYSSDTTVLISQNGAAYATFTVSANIKFSFSRSNYESVHIGPDGMMQVSGDGFIFHNGEAFVVRKGNYMLRITAHGIYKSTNGGSYWTSL